MVIDRRNRSLVSTTRLQVRLSGSMSSRANRLRSFGVSSLGSVLAIPSFFRRRSIDGEKLRFPCLSAGDKGFNIVSCPCAPSWKVRPADAAKALRRAPVQSELSGHDRDRFELCCLGALDVGSGRTEGLQRCRGELTG